MTAIQKPLQGKPDPFASLIQRAIWYMPIDTNYRAAFERLWDAKSSNPVSNAMTEHAAALLSVFFSKAEKRVVVFCKELKKEVYDEPEVLSSLDDAIHRGIEVDVTVQHAVAHDSVFARRLRDAMAAGCNKVAFRDNLEAPVRNVPINFAFADDRAYRFEKDREQLSASASAYLPETVKLLGEFHSQIKESIGHGPVPA